MGALSSAIRIVRRNGLLVLLDRAWERTCARLASWRLSHLLGRIRNLGRLPALSRRHRGGTLNLGRGKDQRAGFLDADLGSAGEAHVDVRRRLPFPDDHFGLIFGEHMIEHLEHIVAERCLRECHRVLQPGGILRVCTPDLGYQIALYEDSEGLGRAWREQAPLFMPWKYQPGEVPTPAQFLNDGFYEWEHRHLYDREDLTRVLTAAGFADIRFLDPGEGAAEHTTHLESPMAGSLAVEAVKSKYE